MIAKCSIWCYIVCLHDTYIRICICCIISDMLYLVNYVCTFCIFCDGSWRLDVMIVSISSIAIATSDRCKILLLRVASKLSVVCNCSLYCYYDRYIRNSYAATITCCIECNCCLASCVSTVVAISDQCNVAVCSCCGVGKLSGLI